MNFLIKYKDIIELLTPVAEILMTLYFSWCLYKLNKRGQDLSEKIADHDIEKEKKETAQVAIEISQVLKYNFSALLENFNLIKYSKTESIFTEFILVDDWINKIGRFTDILSTKEINNLYKFYLELEKIQKNGIKNSTKLLKDVTEKVFKNIFLEYSFYIEKIDFRVFLENEYFEILRKLEKKYTVINKSSSEYEHLKQKLEVSENYNHESTKYTDTLYFKDELVMYKIKIKEFSIGTSGFIDNENKRSGYFTKIDKKSKVEYSGFIKNNKKHGKGKEYENNKLKFEGIFEEGKYQKGIYSSNNSTIVYFQGLYKNGIPYTGKIKIKGFDNRFDYWVKDFEGEIKEGKYFNGIGEKCIEVCIAQKSDPSEIEKLKIENIQECAEAYGDCIVNPDYNEIPDEVLEEQYNQQERIICENESDYLLVYEVLKYESGNIKKIPDKLSYVGMNVSDSF